MSDTRPIIITLQFDEQSAAFFDLQRRNYFPPHINYVPAHLTLFHNLPGKQFDLVLEKAAAVCEKTGSFNVEFDGLLKLGRGVAYRASSDSLKSVRRALADKYEPWLTKQDKQKFRPHITIQNKVAVHEAEALHEYLKESFRPVLARAEGLQFWFYNGGPWVSAGAIAFAQN